MKKRVIALGLTASLIGLAACGNSGDAVVQTKAGDITQDEFYSELKDKYGDAILSEMVTMKVLEDKYEVEKKDIDEQVDKIKEQYGDSFEMILQQQGIPDEDAFRELIRQSLLQEAAIADGVEITEKEMKEKYDRMKTEVKASHILVDDEETAKEVKKKLDEGGDFDKLAKEYSTDSTAENGGDVGYFSPGGENTMVPEFEDAAYSMKVDEISEPVKSQYGYHIIKVTDKRKKEEDIGSYEDNKDDIRRMILNEKVDQTQAQEKIQKLMKDANIDVKDKQFEDLFKIEEPAAEESENKESDDNK